MGAPITVHDAPSEQSGHSAMTHRRQCHVTRRACMTTITASVAAYLLFMLYVTQRQSTVTLRRLARMANTTRFVHHDANHDFLLGRNARRADVMGRRRNALLFRPSKHANVAVPPRSFDHELVADIHDIDEIVQLEPVDIFSAKAAMASTPQAPAPHARRFVYHSLPRTGSHATREELGKLCRMWGVECLTYDNVGMTSIERVAQCFANVKSDSGHALDPLTMTDGRLTACANRWPIVRRNVHSIVDPMDMSSPWGRALVAGIANAYRFTVVRRPTHQFVSLYAYTQHLLHTMNVTTLPPLPTVIEQLAEHKRMGETSWWLYRRLVNVQSTMLGVDANGTLAVYDMVGIAEHMLDVWRTLKHELHAEHMNVFTDVGIDAMDSDADTVLGALSPAHTAMLHNLQDRDTLLYERANELWHRRRH